MSVAIPIWFAEEISFLASSTPRHLWMCDQLLERRRQQANPARILDWLQKQLTLVFGTAVHPLRIFEVLSDGLGYVEPSWHAIEYSEILPSGSSKVAVAQLRDVITELRRHHEDELGDVKTQRAIGGRLYESGLFLVTATASYFFDHGVWRQVVASNLPLKFPVSAATRDASKERSDIDASLTTLSAKVLWPGFFNREPGHYFSLVFLHASLWQSASGVWALHVKSREPLKVPQVGDHNLRATDKSIWQIALQALVDPALRCLEDIVGWASEHEGTQARRRDNVDLFFRATGRVVPRWTADGVHGKFKPKDREVYEITPSPVAADDIRIVLQLAVAAVAEDSYVQRPTSDYDPNVTAVIRCLEALFIAGRLAEQRPTLAEETGSLPPLTVILREYAASEMGVEHDALERTDTATIALKAAARIQALAASDWKRWCAVLLRVTCLTGFAGQDLHARAEHLTNVDRFLEALTSLPPQP